MTVRGNSNDQFLNLQNAIKSDFNSPTEFGHAIFATTLIR